MTKKLRCKFVAIIMSIVTIMLCIIMFLICFFTKMNLENNSVNMMQNIKPVFFEKGLTLRTDISEGIMVNGDPSQLRQVLDILLDNAQKYSREKGTTWVSLERQGRGHCLLTVADEGEEISAGDLPHLFKRFYRADKARSRSGGMEQTGSFGLGLSIAEAIIGRHRGRIWAESKNHVNAFFVELGITAAEPFARSAKSSPSR